jgi:NAD(P)H-hydrate epimerase
MKSQADRLYTARQVQLLDQSAIEAHGIPGIELMERAGQSVFAAAREYFPRSVDWLVFCGAGNNGGDGYVLARLAQQAGIRVTLCALKPVSALQGEAAVAGRSWLAAGGEVHPWPPAAGWQPDLIFDALLGTGLDRKPEGDFASAISWINQNPAPVIAVDIPSGLDADSGTPLGEAVKAVLTVTFIGNKRGLYTADGPDHCGQVRFSALQTPESVQESIKDSGILIRQNIIEYLLPRRARNSHKGTFGWVLGIGGNSHMSGAVRLCGEAALRSGAGKVTLATIPEHAAMVNLSCPELMVRGVKKGKELSSLLEQVNACVLGTGLGQTSWSEDLYHTCLKSKAPMVLDADGLNILARHHPGGARQGRLPRGNWILTPHPAEAGRLMDCSAREIQQDRVVAAQRIAEAYDAVVVLKGCGTVIARPDGFYAICPLGNPGMATAGTGDVLAGVIGAMLAQGLSDWESAMLGVVVHAHAGDLAANQIGERGMIASDIIARLPVVLNP